MKSNLAIRACGWIWLFGGVMLLRKGLFFASELSASQEPVLTSSWFGLLCTWLGTSQRASMFILLLGVLIGFMKARMVLAKSATRNIERLQNMQDVAFYNIFDTKMLVIIAFMMGLGFTMNHLPIAFEWRALIDVAVGSALVVGAGNYFRGLVRTN